ncbi:hypothetical protein GOA90_25210 [Sinorhizobium meliloti]|nr:hypothetical protein [Sinorhizobium meliloti]
MAKVRALTRGYFGGIVREPGDVFSVPDDLWDDEKRRPKWCAPAAFGGKGDHDGDGKPGGSVPAAEAPKRGRGRSKAETVETPETDAFADAPAPETVKGNGVKEALGVAPDWIAPGSEVPEMAEE